MLRELLLIKLRALKGMLRSKEDRMRAPVFTIMSVLFVVMLYGAADYIVVAALDIQPVGQLLVHRLLAITVLVFFAMLLFSNVVTAFSSFYLADDLEFLMGQPIPQDTLFTSRFVEALVQSSWIVILFGMPLFVSVGVNLGASWEYYATLLVVLVPFVTIPAALASIVALFATNIIAANRTRDAALFFGVVVFASLFVIIRSFEPERLLNPDSFDSIGEIMQLLSVPSTAYLPNDWVVNILTPHLFDLQTPAAWSAALLFTTAVALYFLATWLHRPLYFRGYSNTQEGRNQGGALNRVRDWFLQRAATLGGDLEEQIEGLRKKKGKESALRQLVQKDQAVFTRDASQWSQLLIVMAIIVIYLVNFKYFEIAAEEALIGDAGLSFFNLAACAFVVVTLCGRFLFPAVSLEGRSFWLILQAPVSMERFLVGKLLGGILPIVIVGQLLIWSSNLLVGISVWTAAIMSAQVLLLSFFGAGMAVGMGAMYPQFHNPNAARIASSFGAVVFMIVTILLTLVFIALWFTLARELMGFFRGGYISFFGMLSAGGGLVLCLGLIPVSLKLGARSLKRRF